MQVKMEKLEKTDVKLEVEVSPEKFEEGLEKSYRRNIKRFKVNGFRPGKVPRNIVERVYGEEVLYEDAVNYILPEEYDAAIEELKLDPVSEPQFDIKEISHGKLIFTAEVTLKPEVKLGQYKGLEITEPDAEVTEDDIMADLEKTAEQNSRMVEVTDRPAENGDVVNIDFTGYLDGEEFEGGKGESYPLELGSNSFIPGFEDQLVGCKAGDEKDVNVTFPEDYHAEEMAGKAVTFKVKVHDVKAKELPAIDDDFASDVSEFDTLEEYKKSIAEKLKESKESAAKTAMEAEAVEKATAGAEVDIPHVMIHNRAHDQVHELEHQIANYGMSMDMYLQYMGKTSEEELVEEYEERAEIEVRQMLVMEAIAKDAGIEVTDEELDAELQEIADQYNMSLEEVKERMGERNIGYQKDNIKIRKAVEMLVAEAKKVKAPAEKPAAKKPAAKKPAAKKTAAKKTEAKEEEAAQE